MLSAHKAIPHSSTGHLGSRRGIAYIIDADLESQPHKSKLSESGINTLSTNTYLIGQFTATQQNQMVHTFAHYDGILVIKGGLASVQF